MKFWSIAVGALVVLLAASGLFVYMSVSGNADAPVDLRDKTEVSIVLTNEGYTPNNIRITKGTRVTFTTTTFDKFWPASNAHPNHTIYPEFDPKEVVVASSSWSFVFDRVGVWGLHDHVYSYFTGVIHVEN